jgi:hypothetical protein
MKIKMTIEIELEDGFGFEENEQDAIDWFKNEVLVADGSLVLYSNEAEDILGVVTEISNIEYYD